jgi:hypothetical protein
MHVVGHACWHVMAAKEVWRKSDRALGFGNVSRTPYKANSNYLESTSTIDEVYAD